MTSISSGVATILASIAMLWSGSATAETLLLTDAFGPWWNADGGSLLCARCASPCDDEDSQIWTVPLSGGEPDTMVIDPAGAYFPMWLPGGQQFVYYRPRVAQQMHHEFVIYDLQQGIVRVWEVTGGIWDDPGFNLTPDGTEILYSKDTGGSRETWALHLSTGTTRYVHEGSGGVLSPDGQWIAYFTDEDSLAVAPIDGPPLLIPDLGCCARWTPDGQYIVFSGISASGNLDLIARSRSGVYRQELTDDADQDWYCAISPDGSQVAYSKKMSEFAPSSLWLMDLQIGEPTMIEEVSWGRIKATYR